MTIEIILYLTIALYSSASALYSILRFAPIRENFAKRGPDFGLLTILSKSLGLFPFIEKYLWLLVLDSFLCLTLYLYIILQYSGISVTYSVIGVRKSHKKYNKIPSYMIYKRLLAEGQRLVALESESFLAILMRYAWKISELIIHRDRKVTAKIRVFYRLGKYLVFLNKKHGSLFTVKYLKASLLAIQRAIAGTPVKSLREIEPDLPLPRLAKCGLPAWIGTRDRRAIMSHSLSVVQFYLTIFSLHRVIDSPVKAKLETITDPFSGLSDFLEKSLGFFEFEFKKLIKVPEINLKGLRGREAGFLLLQTSSSSNQIFSWWGWAYDAWLIRTDPAQYALIRKWLELSNNFELLSILNMSRVKPSLGAIQWKDLLTGFVYTSRELSRLLTFLDYRDKNGNDYFDLNLGFKKPKWGLGPRFKKIFLPGVLGVRPDAALGRLSFKEEAAGKLRVFAMVDSWTQAIFKPLHDSLFRLLGNLPNDATFNQGEAFQRAVTKAEKYGHSYGYDLSAATDRLPLILQIKLLSGLIGPHLASLWGLILTERDYRLPENKYGIPEGYLRYAVGQPMGALSSWAMLALCHHAIVQYANRLIGNRSWTEAYEVLGDDIVIFEPSLAKKYVELMSSFGVELNMAKSVVSHGPKPVVEFAKRTSLLGSDVSPLSLKMFLNQESFKGRLAIFDWWSQRIKSHFIPAFRTILKSVRWDDRPGKDKFALLGLLSMSVSKGVLPFEWLLRELKDTRSFIIRKGNLLLTDFPTEWGLKIAKAICQKEDISSFEPRSPHSYMFEQRWYKAAIIRRIRALISTYELKKGPDSAFLFKMKVLGKIGLASREGVFVRHLYLEKFDDLLAKPFLTLSFYKAFELPKFSLELLIGFLEEVESAASIISTMTKETRVSKAVEDHMKFLRFIDKSIADKFREDERNAKLALQSSWTEVSKFGDLNPKKNLSSFTDRQRHMMFGIPMPLPPTAAAQPGWLGVPGSVTAPYVPLSQRKIEVEKPKENFRFSLPPFFWMRFTFGALVSLNLLSLLRGDDPPSSFSSVPNDRPYVLDGPSPPGGLGSLPFPSGFDLILFLFLLLPFLALWYYCIQLQLEIAALEQSVEFYSSNIRRITESLPMYHTRSHFIFPSYSELIEWQGRPRMVRSPEIGFGWTEPWVQNTDWPEAYR